MDLHEGLLEQVGEKIPVFLSKWAGAQPPLNGRAIDEYAANNDGGGREEVASPLSLLVNHNEEGHEERQLEVSGDRPSPEEAPVVRSLEVWVEVADHEKVGPPVILAVVIHQTSFKPDWPSTQMWKDGPPAEEDQIVHGSEAEIFAPPELQAILETDVALRLIQREELVCTQECRKEGEGFHDDASTENDCKEELLEELIDNPRIDSLCAHHELRSDTELGQEEAKELGALNRIQLTVVPEFALAAGKGGPAAHDGK